MVFRAEPIPSQEKICLVDENFVKYRSSGTSKLMDNLSASLPASLIRDSSLPGKNNPREISIFPVSTVKTVSLAGIDLQNLEESNASASLS